MRKIGAFKNLLVSYSQFKESPRFGQGGYGPGHEPRGELTKSENEPAVKCYYLSQRQCQKELSDIDSFLFEVDCYASLRHPAVLELLGYTLPVLGETNCGFFFPDTSNKNLEYILNPNSHKEFSPTCQSIIIFGIAAGMAYVHQNNIFHRCLSPTNIVIDDNFHPKISDFSLSIYLIEGDDEIIPEYALVGVPAYMAPEYINCGTLTKKSDVYSYSSILYQILTKKHPYDVHKSNKFKPGIPPSVSEGEVPPVFLDLMKSCWDSNPENRPSFIHIVKEFMDRRNEFFSQPGIDMNQLNNYITEVTKDLVFP